MDEEYQEIVTNIHDYALVKISENDSIYYRLFHKPTMAYVLIERDRDKLIDVLLANGILIANNKEEFRPKDFKTMQWFWDEEKKEGRMVSEKEIRQILEELAKKKEKE